MIGEYEMNKHNAPKPVLLSKKIVMICLCIALLTAVLPLPASAVTNYKWEKWSCNVTPIYSYSLSAQSSGSWGYGGTAFPSPVTTYSGYSISNGTFEYSGGQSFVLPFSVYDGHIYFGSASVMYSINSFAATPYGLMFTYSEYVITATPTSNYSYSKGSTMSGYAYGAAGSFPSNDKQLDTTTNTYFWYVYAGEAASGTPVSKWEKWTCVTNYAYSTQVQSSGTWTEIPTGLPYYGACYSGYTISNGAFVYTDGLGCAFGAGYLMGYAYFGSSTEMYQITHYSVYPPYIDIGYLKYVINATVSSYSKGATLLGYVYDTSGAYPSNGRQYNSATNTNYWYVYLGESISTVSFNSNGGSSVAAQSIYYGSKATTPTVPIKAEYTLVGWYRDSSLLTPWNFATDTVDGSIITLYAKWAPNSCTISFETNGGTSVSSATQNYNTTIASAPSTNKTGYTFNGWYSDSGLTTAVSFPYTITGNATLYAKWTLNSYTINFETNGGTSVSSVTQNNNTTIDSAPSATRTGYTFNGWYSDSGLTTAVSFPYTITGNATLYAKWTLNSYTINFETNGGTSVSSITQNYNTTIDSAPSTTITNNTFGGWYSDVGLTTAVSFPYTITGNATLYAKWTLNCYTISFNTNGGTSVSSVTQNNNTTIDSAPSTTKIGYTFSGWYSDSGLTTAVSFPYTIADNTTLYAKWTLNSYTINFETNGGTAVSSLTQNYNTTIDSALSTTKTGYTFSGWYSDAGLTTVVSFPYTITANTTLYAKWTTASTELVLSITTNNTYLISMNVENESSFTGATYTITYDSTKLQISDLCTFTYAKETTAGTITGTGITIISVSPGTITLAVDKTIPSGSKWSGVLDIFEFKALTTGSTIVSIQ
jgi:uncharacterized repeat protein (TIGR02543 family)